MTIQIEIHMDRVVKEIIDDHFDTPGYDNPCLGCSNYMSGKSCNCTIPYMNQSTGYPPTFSTYGTTSEVL